MNLPPDNVEIHSKYISLNDPDSASETKYYNIPKDPHKMYQVLPSFANEIKLDW